MLALVVVAAAAFDTTAEADTAPPDTTTPSTVSSDPLPTVQIDGVVWSQVIVGDTVYVGGEFTTARPAGAAPGSQTVARSNFLAYNLTTGALVDSFAPSFNAQVRAIAASPDGSTLYVGGQFTQVNGVNRYRIVAFDLATGNVKNSFAVVLNSSIYGLVATNSTVYATGIFTSANNVARSGVVAVSAADGSVLPFSVTPAGGTVRQIIVSPDATKVVLGGAFTTINGSNNPGYGLAMLDAVTGAPLPLPVNSVIRNGGSLAAIMTLASASDGFYGAGYTYTRSQGNLEGTFKADWSGNLIFVQDCHGDEYSISVTSDALYVAGHPHYCGNVGSFPQTQPWTYHRALAFTTDVRGKIATDPWNYFNFVGQPTPAQLNWYPDIDAGTYTGQAQGPWSTAANENYVLYGGEFPVVNGTPQQGLVRFAKTSIAPNADGPRLGGDFAGVTVRSYGNNALRVAWPANYDRDNERLTYRVYRDNQQVYETTVNSRFYLRPNLSYLDTTVTPGRSYTYRVRATDPFNNAMWSTSVSGTAGAGTTLSRYQRAVLADGPQTYWSLNETSGSTVSDVAGSDNAVKGSQITTGVPGAIAGESGTAFRLTGSSSSTMNNTTSQPSMDYFSTEAWFKTTTTRGGQIIGFDSSSSGGGSYADRHVYMNNSGQLYFVARPNSSYKWVNSAGTYRDGNWHHVVATMSGAGMALYVDGARVGFDEQTKSGLQFNTRVGYWKMGGDTIGSSYPSRPTSNYFAGDLDEVATYPVALTSEQIQAHYNLGATGVAPNVPPTAAFGSTVNNLSVSFDASASSDSDGTLASYAWSFGDGTTGSGVSPSHAYTAAGTYAVNLVVTDDNGATGSITQNVTVTEPPNAAPTASFTSSSTDLTVSVDGTGSTDSDGTIASYAWDFGDGTSGSGATTDHTYAVAGSYVVKLTVTDDDGAQNTASNPVTVPTGGPAAYALDEFNRTASNWESSDIGGAWTTQGGNTGFSVASGDGVIGVAPGVRRTALLPAATSASTDLTTAFTTDKLATGGGTFVTVFGRRVSNSDDYRLEMKINNKDQVSASISAQRSGTVSSLTGSSVTLPGTYVAGTDVNVRFRITGDSPTTLEAKIWLGSDPEPAAWTLTATDSHPALQAAGSPGFSVYQSGSATGGTMSLLVHRVAATP